MAVAAILIAVIVWKSLKMKPLDTTFPASENDAAEAADTSGTDTAGNAEAFSENVNAGEEDKPSDSE